MSNVVTAAHLSPPPPHLSDQSVSRSRCEEITDNTLLVYMIISLIETGKWGTTKTERLLKIDNL